MKRPFPFLRSKREIRFHLSLEEAKKYIFMPPDAQLRIMGDGSITPISWIFELEEDKTIESFLTLLTVPMPKEKTETHYLQFFAANNWYEYEPQTYRDENSHTFYLNYQHRDEMKRIYCSLRGRYDNTETLIIFHQTMWHPYSFDDEED